MKKFNDIMLELSSGEASNLYGQIGQFLLWAFIIFLAAWFVQKTITRRIADNTSRYRTKKTIRFLSYILILLLAVVSFTGKMQYFTLTIGLFSAGLAFALQEVILSFAGWVSIQSTRMYKPGDRIELNGVKGDVIDISLTRTTMMELGEWVKSDNYTGRIVQISNSQVFKGPVRNYSADFPFLWDEIMIPIRYGSDLQLTKSILEETASLYLSEYAVFAKDHWQKMVEKYLIEDANVQPTVSLKLTDNWVEFTMRYVVDYKRRRLTKNDISGNLLQAIENTNGKVSLASATFELTSLPPINIQPKV